MAAVAEIVPNRCGIGEKTRQAPGAWRGEGSGRRGGGTVADAAVREAGVLATGRGRRFRRDAPCGRALTPLPGAGSAGA